MVVVGVVAGDQDPGHGAVAGQPPARLGVQRSGPPELASRALGVAPEAVEVDGHQQLGANPTGLRELPGFQVAAGQLSKGISIALAATTAVLGVGWAGQGF